MGFAYFEKSGYSMDYLVAVAAGKIPGFAILDKYGRNGAAGTISRPVWIKGNQSYTWPTGPEGFRAYSDVNAATNSIVFECVDSDWATQSVTAVLTGTTPINLGTFLRCNRVYNNEPGRLIGTISGYVEVVGSGAVTAGTTGIAGTPAPEMVKARISGGYEQTQQAIFSVPANQNLQIFGVWGGMNESSGVSAVAMDLELWVGGTNKTMRNKRTQGFTNLGGNPAVIPFGVPLLVGSKSDVELRVLCGATGLDVSGGFYGLLIDV